MAQQKLPTWDLGMPDRVQESEPPLTTTQGHPTKGQVEAEIQPYVAL